LYGKHCYQGFSNQSVENILTELPASEIKDSLDNENMQVPSNIDETDTYLVAIYAQEIVAEVIGQYELLMDQ
jgi:hypothetical protein